MDSATTRMTGAEAVIRCLEIIGEAANKVSRDDQKAHPAIDWREIIGTRHRLIHNYAAARTCHS